MSLKYYADERAKYPNEGVLLLGEQQVRAICDRFFTSMNLKPLPVEFDDRMERTAGAFIYNFFTRRCKLKFAAGLISARTVLHELAHYADFARRCREIDEIDHTASCGMPVEGTKGLSAEAACAIRMATQKIRREHFHGPRHRLEMAVAVKWFNENNGWKPVPVVAPVATAIDNTAQI